MAALLDVVAPNIGFVAPALPKIEPPEAPEDAGVPVFKLPNRLPVAGAAEVLLGLPNSEAVVAVPEAAPEVCPPNMLLPPPPKVGGFAPAEPNNPPPVLGVADPNIPPAGGAVVVCPAPKDGAEVVFEPNGLLGAAPPLFGVGLKLKDMVLSKRQILEEDSYKSM